ncbi:IclR family transcriptional regulator [Microbacterium sp. GXF7504]
MAETGSQTLARGLTALTLIGEAATPLSVPEVADLLGVHRSMAYRLVRTLEDLGFVVRDGAGLLHVGAKVVSLARGVSGDLATVAAPELAALADDLGMTVCIVTYDGAEAVTLTSSEPRRDGATLAQRPGSRHSIDAGAPGRVIRSQLRPEQHPPLRYETSHDEIIVGVSSVAVPLPLGAHAPAALAVIYLTQDLDTDAVATALERTAHRIARLVR